MTRIGLLLGLMAALAGGVQEVEIVEQGGRQFCRIETVQTTPLKPASDNVEVKIVKAEVDEQGTSETVVIDLVSYPTN